MNIAVRASPPPGSAQAGDLYVDLQSRTIWLGVDVAVDESGFVLVSDIETLTSEIISAEADAKAYTDTKILTRAPTTHTHTASQITDFSSAVTAIASAIPALQFTRGMIMLWSGSLAEIGIGALAGWSLCDGSNGTPDLRDRFVIGAGNKTVGSKNVVGTSNLITDTLGAHTHTIGAVALTAAQLPSHAHGPGNLSGYAAGNTGGISANHQHQQTVNVTGGSSGLLTQRTSTASGSQGSENYTGYVTSDHSHALNVGAYMNGGATAAVGAGDTHTHSIDTQGSHFHTMTSNAVREATPYYALAFIMKL